MNNNLADLQQKIQQRQQDTITEAMNNEHQVIQDMLKPLREQLNIELSKITSDITQIKKSYQKRLIFSQIIAIMIWLAIIFLTLIPSIILTKMINNNMEDYQQSKSKRESLEVMEQIVEIYDNGIEVKDKPTIIQTKKGWGIKLKD